MKIIPRLNKTNFLQPVEHNLNLKTSSFKIRISRHLLVIQFCITNNVEMLVE